MKAKEMAAEYEANPVDDTLIELIRKLIIETGDIAKKRGVRTNSGMAAILREQDDKWKAFVRRVGGKWVNAFRDGISTVIPESKELVW